jgi:hypothetical protein
MTKQLHRIRTLLERHLKWKKAVHVERGKRRALIPQLRIVN